MKKSLIRLNESVEERDEPIDDVGQASFNKILPDKPENFANEPAKETSSIDEQNDPEEIGTDT